MCGGAQCPAPSFHTAYRLPTGAGCFSYLFGDCNYTGQCSLGEPQHWCLGFVKSALRPASLSKAKEPIVNFPQAENAARPKVLLPLNKGTAIPKSSPT